MAIFTGIIIVTANYELGKYCWGYITQYNTDTVLLQKHCMNLNYNSFRLVMAEEALINVIEASNNGIASS